MKKAVNSGELVTGTPIICELYGIMTCWCMSDGKFEPLDWTNKFCEIQLKKLFKDYIVKKEDL